MRYLMTAIALAAGIVSAQARAEVVDLAANGFEIRQTLHIAASPQKVWATLVQPAKWWNSAHTFSGNADGLTLDAHAGGCWCEKLPNGGSVQHLVVTYVAPEKTLILRGALGPFFNTGTENALNWTLNAVGDETDVVLVFRAGGYVKGGFEKLAPAVDEVLKEQFSRLKSRLETKP